MPPIPPWPYALVLATAVGLGLPAGALVVGAGALFGPGIGLLTVLFGEALGLALNWQLCRGWLRPRVQRWLGRQRRGRRLQGLLTGPLQAPASLRLLLLLRLALIPMNLVNAACALGPTPLRRYALASLMLVPRFSLLVGAGGLLKGAAGGSLGPAALALRGVALVATAAVLVLLSRGLLLSRGQRR
jgi:uncharacterized membrane protein YdjX (TVP38/TMEM64 family)